MDEQQELAALIDLWRKVIIGEEKSWVLFEHGTCLILMQPEADLQAQARAIMQEWGPVLIGTPSADFNVVPLVLMPGWVVTGHHPDMLNYVGPEEFDIPDPETFAIGLIGRSNRDADAHELKIVHVEDKRKK